MKKILLTTAIVLATVSISVNAGFNSSKYNWNGSSATKSVVNNTLIAHGYNRNNSISTSDIKKIGSGKLGYAATLASVELEQAKAKKVGFEWNTIRKLMTQAKKDHKAGNDKAAIKKLNTAIHHAILGQRQAIAQKNAGPRF